jgi:phage regulator Rha-like protein
MIDSREIAKLLNVDHKTLIADIGDFFPTGESINYIHSSEGEFLVHLTLKQTGKYIQSLGENK